MPWLSKENCFPENIQALHLGFYNLFLKFLYGLTKNISDCKYTEVASFPQIFLCIVNKNKIKPSGLARKQYLCRLPSTFCNLGSIKLTSVDV